MRLERPLCPSFAITASDIRPCYVKVVHVTLRQQNSSMRIFPSVRPRESSHYGLYEQLYGHPWLLRVLLRYNGQRTAAANVL